MADQTNQTPTADHQVDGGEPTAAEAALAAELLELGDDKPAPAPDAAAAAAADASDAEAGAAAAAPAPAAAPAAGDATTTETEDAPLEPEADATAVAGTEASQALAAGVPAPEKDFDQAYTDLQGKFDRGELDGTAYQHELRQITREEAAWSARVAIWQEQQRSAVTRAAEDFNSAALAWEDDHAAFMANPLRAAAMQQAIASVDAQSPGLAPADLLSAAQKIAFEAYGYTETPAPDAAAKIAAATAARAPARVPATLASAAAAAPIEAATHNATFANLDSNDISSLEDALARMPRDQLDAYLREAPGGNTRGN